MKNIKNIVYTVLKYLGNFFFYGCRFASHMVCCVYVSEKPC